MGWDSIGVERQHGRQRCLSLLLCLRGVGRESVGICNRIGVLGVELNVGGWGELNESVGGVDDGRGSCLKPKAVGGGDIKG